MSGNYSPAAYRGAARNVYKLEDVELENVTINIMGGGYGGHSGTYSGNDMPAGMMQHIFNAVRQFTQGYGKGGNQGQGQMPMPWKGGGHGHGHGHRKGWRHQGMPVINNYYFGGGFPSGHPTPGPQPTPTPTPAPAPQPSPSFGDKALQALNNGADIWVVSEALGGQDYGIGSVEVANDVRWVLNNAGILPSGQNVGNTAEATTLLAQAFGSASPAQQAIWAERLANNIGVDFGLAPLNAANQKLTAQVGANPNYQAFRDHFYGAQA